MNDIVDKCSVKGCSIDVGTLIDNENCQCLITRDFDSNEEAKIYLSKVIKLAELTTSEIDNLVITHEIKNINEKVNVRFTCVFPYQAETIIFELAEKRIK